MRFLPACLRMEIDFKTQAGPCLDFSSFKAYDSTFKIDITDRLLKVATRISSERRNDVIVPSGSYKIVLRTNDDQSHMDERELQFKVA